MLKNCKRVSIRTENSNTDPVGRYLKPAYFCVRSSIPQTYHTLPTPTYDCFSIRTERYIFDTERSVPAVAPVPQG